MTAPSEARPHTKRAIEQSLALGLEQLGWTRHKLCGFHPVYAKSLAVTPYFWCEPIRSVRARGHVIEGAVGVIHQAFESEWERTHGDNSRPTIILHTANISELSEPSVILDSGDLDDQVRAFCQRVSLMLASLPQSDAQLRESFALNVLYRFPVAKFAGRDPDKLQALREFLQSPTKH